MGEFHGLKNNGGGGGQNAHEVWRVVVDLFWIC